MESAKSSDTGGRLLLLRGLTRESGHWGNFCDVLNDELPDWSVLNLDLPGTGAQFQEPPGYRVQDFSDSILTQLSTHPAQPTVIVGMSLGGMVTLDLLSRAPDAFVGAVFINTSEASMSSWYERISPKAVLGLAAALASPSIRAREALVHRLTSINAQHSKEESAPWVSIAKKRPVAKRVLAAQLLAAARYRAPAKVTQPLLWLASKQDRFVDEACTRRLWERFGGDLSVYPFAGHDLALDAPQWTARRIRSFLNKKVNAALR